jgi:hypothetical protein
MRGVIAALLAGCVADRPIHPLDLEGFPGAPVEPGLFPLRPGMRWTFLDRVAAERREFVLSVEGEPGALRLLGSKEGEVGIRVSDGFLELRYRGQALERPLKFEGAAGDTWKTAGATYTVFGYDEVEVLGRRVRSLVVAADRPPVRDLYWFAKDLGWIRLRQERNGKTYRDAILTAFEPGGAN